MRFAHIFEIFEKLEIREKVFPRKHRDKCRQKRFRSMCSVKKAERKIYAPICSEIRSDGDRRGGGKLQESVKKRKEVKD